MAKVQIRKVIEKPIIGEDGKKTRKKEKIEDVRIVHRVDFFQQGSWHDQGYEIIAEAGMNFKKQRYGATEDDE